VNAPTDDQVRAALAENGRRIETGRWTFDGGVDAHSETSALAITRACLILGVPVTDILTGEMWNAVLSELVALGRRVDALEAGS
jgi:hypothetical protein